MDTDHNRFDEESPSAHLFTERTYGGSMFGGARDANDGMRPQRATTGGEDAMRQATQSHPADDAHDESRWFDEGGACVERSYTDSGRARRAEARVY